MNQQKKSSSDTNHIKNKPSDLPCLKCSDEEIEALNSYFENMDKKRYW